MAVEQTAKTSKILRTMTEITYEDYKKFVNEHSTVTIEDVEIKLGVNWIIKSYGPPSDYKLEKTTVWSFPDRGKWATHQGNYRGNWSPYIPRNLILKYTKKEIGFLIK